jgi:hypothetical protein
MPVNGTLMQRICFGKNTDKNRFFTLVKKNSESPIKWDADATDFFTLVKKISRRTPFSILEFNKKHQKTVRTETQKLLFWSTTGFVFNKKV